MGYLAGAGVLDDAVLRRAMVFGSAMGSYAVEDFSVNRFRTLDVGDVRRRVQEFRKMTAFEAHPEADDV